MREVWTILMALSLGFEFVPIQARAQTQVQTQVQILQQDSSLDARFLRLEEAYQKQRLTAGSILLATGTVSLGVAAATPLVTDYDRAKSYPIVFGVTGVLMTFAGFYILAKPSEVENVSENFLKARDSDLESMDEKQKLGVSELHRLAIDATGRRKFYSILKLCLGASQGVLAFTDPDTRAQDLRGTGYGFSAIALYSLVAEKKIAYGGPIGFTGFANMLTSALDSSAPSKNYLLFTGGFLVSAGLISLLTDSPVETEDPKVAFGFLNDGGQGAAAAAAAAAVRLTYTF